MDWNFWGYSRTKLFLSSNCCNYYVQERHGNARQSAVVARRNQTNVTTPTACKMTAPAFNEIKNSSSAGRFWGEALDVHFHMRCVARELWLYVLLTVKNSRYYAVKQGRPEKGREGRKGIMNSNRKISLELLRSRIHRLCVTTLYDESKERKYRDHPG